MIWILSPSSIVSFSGPENRPTNGGNETIVGGLKQLEEIENFLQIGSISKWTVVEKNKWNKSGILGTFPV